MRALPPVALAAIGLHLAGLGQSVPEPDFVTDARLVLIAVTALDRSGQFAQDLRLDEFVLEDEGKRRTIENMWREDSTPLTIGLIADTSGSQVQEIPQHERTLSLFLRQVLRPQDRAFLVSIPYEARMVVDVTNSVNELQRGVQRLHSLHDGGSTFGESCSFRMLRGLGPVPTCSTALWNAVYTAAKLRMKKIEGRKALIVLSDGLDNGSQHTLRDSIEAAQSAGAPVYTIYTGHFLTSLGHGKAPLARLAKETGGRSYTSDEEGSAKIFAEIENELRNTYVLAFTPPPDARDRKFHKLKVSSKRRGVTIRTRTGYFADK